jgi:hypothetical protein
MYILKMENNKNNRFKYKHDAVKFKDDDYETQSDILNDLIPYIPEGIIYDPFYCTGKVIEEWKKLNRVCINEKKDAFTWKPENFDLVVSNIPFSMKEKCVKLCLDLDKPFALLMPIDALGSKWIKKYFDKLQFLIPNGRYSFLKNGKMGKGSWFDTMWVCYKLKLPQNIIKL